MAPVSDSVPGSAAGETFGSAIEPACTTAAEVPPATPVDAVPHVVSLDTGHPGASMALDLDLLPEQRVALTMLLDNKSIAAAARAAGVSRPMIYKWRDTDAAFIAAMNLWRRQARQSVGDGMALLSEKAMAVLAAALDKNDLRAARIVLDYVQRARIGPGNADKVARRLSVRKRLRQLAEVELEAREEAATAPKPPPGASKPPAPKPMKLGDIKTMLRRFNA